MLVEKIADKQKKLPKKVMTFILKGQWTGAQKYPGINWLAQCEICRGDRIVNTSIWNSGNLKCDCQKKLRSRGPGLPRGSLLSHLGETMTVSEWAERTGVSVSAIYNRNKRRDSMPAPKPTDEWVIFGTAAKDHPDRTIAPDAYKQLDRTLAAIERHCMEVLQPAFVRSVEKVVEDKIKPLILGWLKSGRLNLDHEFGAAQSATVTNFATVTNSVTVTNYPSESTDPNLLPCLDPDAKAKGRTYSATPHPLDDEQLCRDATFGEYRKRQGLKDAEYVYEVRETSNTLNHTYEEIKAAMSDDPVPIPAPAPAPALIPIRKPTPEFGSSRPANAILPLPGHEHHCEEPWLELKHPLPEEFPAQEDTDSLTQEEVDEILAAPWWKERIDAEKYPGVPGHICRSMYDRINAYNLYHKPKKDYGNRQEMGWGFGPSNTYCASHRELNDYSDYLRALYHVTLRHKVSPGDMAVVPALLIRLRNWQASADTRIKDRARAILAEVHPDLRAHLEEQLST